MPPAALHFQTISLVIIHRLHAALCCVPCLYYSFALQSVSLTCKQMEISYGLTFFPYGFVSPTCQANGKQISLESDRRLFLQKKKKKKTPNEITNISVAGLWNVTAKAFKENIIWCVSLEELDFKNLLFF